MKTVIFTFEGASESRQENAKKLSEQLGAEIYIGGTDTIKNTTDICKKYNDDLLILEDDVSLCENFKELVKTVIDNYSDRVINFHYNCFPDKRSKIETLKGLNLYKISGMNYIWNQCFYVPTKIREKIIDSEKGFRRTYPFYVRTKQQDVFIANCIRETSFIAVYPSLVTHLDFGSSIREGKSQTTIFPFDN